MSYFERLPILNKSPLERSVRAHTLTDEEIESRSMGRGDSWVKSQISKMKIHGIWHNKKGLAQADLQFVDIGRRYSDKVRWLSITKGYVKSTCEQLDPDLQESHE